MKTVVCIFRNAKVFDICIVYSTQTQTMSRRAAFESTASVTCLFHNNIIRASDIHVMPKITIVVPTIVVKV